MRPSFSWTGPTRPLISSARLAISPAARSSSARRDSATLWARASPVWDEDVDGDRLQLIAHALAAAPRQGDREGGPEQGADDEQEDAER